MLKYVGPCAPERTALSGCAEHLQLQWQLLAWRVSHRRYQQQASLSAMRGKRSHERRRLFVARLEIVDQQHQAARGAEREDPISQGVLQLLAAARRCVALDRARHA